ncbi:two-component sensor histidine kinase [Thermopolyspora flexuosa]|uniref:histidine kinase n=2 Tax=Thermopolyspora flexuosa TaxID=103836 RepID=A0A543J1K3_9ACTN|nr:signal transduction histidine kinase [Thermopolyspora flexuosa]GGM86146.1 two-component sensor histidine kinase [Thermopolyspora flexuosa]
MDNAGTVLSMRRIPARTMVSLAIVGTTVAGLVVTWLLRRDLQPNALDVLLPLVAMGGVLVRERWPVVALVVVMAATLAYYPYSALDAPIIFLPFVALFTAAERGHLVPAIAIGATGLIVMGLGETGEVRHVDDSAFMMISGWVVAAIAAGSVSRNRSRYLQEAERRAREAEQNREAEARRRAGEERLRIARELHDVIGHNVSLINVQASAALHGLEKRPEDAERALRAIKDISKETLRELRATLGALRQVDEEAPTTPADSLARVDELVRSSGLDVRTELSGPLDRLPVEVDLAATRIIREALTNVHRHSGTNEATLTITRDDGRILIEVADDGPGAAFTEGSGLGILGMRERAAALGGTVEAGPRPEGGFRVTAELPLNGVR